MVAKQVCVIFSTCALTFSTTRGFACPTFRTPMPPVKSMNVLPSTSVIWAPPASRAKMGSGAAMPAETAALRRSINSRLLGPGISVFILVEPSMLLPPFRSIFLPPILRPGVRVPLAGASPAALPRQGDEAQKLVRHVRRQKRRYLPGPVVLRVNLHHVAPDDVQAREAAHKLLRLAAGEAPDLRCSGTGRERRVHEVHVEGDVGFDVADAFVDAPDHLRYPQLAGFVGGDEIETHIAGVAPVPRVVDGAAHPDLDGARRLEQNLLYRPA